MKILVLSLKVREENKEPPSFPVFLKKIKDITFKVLLLLGKRAVTQAC